jgi:hypothetical protein
MVGLRIIGMPNSFRVREIGRRLWSSFSGPEACAWAGKSGATEANGGESLDMVLCYYFSSDRNCVECGNTGMLEGWRDEDNSRQQG